jgi:hypothetical protein
MGLTSDLPNALVKCGGAFDQLGYHYETPEKTQFYIGDLTTVLCKAIAEVKPEWVRLI